MFSAPLWLLALAALVIPLALHLWSRRPRQVLRVGTLRHLGDLPQARARSARLSDPLLLLLRLLILATVIVGLAGPRLGGNGMGLPARLTLVSPELLGDPALDSLDGTTVHLIAAGLPERRLTKGMAPDSGAAIPLWDALKAADQLVAPGGVIDLYTRPRLASLGQSRPAIRAAVRWHAPAAGTRRQWVADLSRLPGDSIQAILGDGDATSITYQRIRTTALNALPVRPSTPPREPELRRLALRASASPGEPVTPSQATRLNAATRAATEELGQRTTFVAEPANADTTLTLPASLIASDALADSLLERWPWKPLAADSLDPREVSTAEATPRAALPGHDRGDSPKTRELLILAALLLFVERWLSSRTRRSPA
jgi:hypothetical protein